MHILNIRMSPLIALTLGLGLINISAAPTLVTGFVKREMFLNIPGATVPDLAASQKFIDNQPDGVTLLESLEAPATSGENFGQRLSGFLIPPVSGVYVFFLAADDAAELWVSPFGGDDPPNLLVASVLARTDRREWNKFASQHNVALPFSLEAGTAYSFEVLTKEDSLGDHVAVGWVLPGQYVDPNTPDGLTNINVIGGNAVGVMVETANSSVAITLPPASVTSFTGSRATFSIQAEGRSDLGTDVRYQWKRNGQDIAGANASAYLTPELTLTDSGARYSCVASVPGAAATSPEATLTVRVASPPRLQISAPAPSGQDATVSWEPFDLGFNLQSISSLNGPDWTSAPEPVTYGNGLARVAVPAVNNRFFRLRNDQIGQESLWSPDMKPDNDVSGSPGYELGTVFSSAVPGTIKAIRIYSLPGESGMRLARLWRNSDGVMVGGPYEVPVLGGEGWVAFDLPQPLAIMADVDYTVSVSTAQDPARVFPRSLDALALAGGNDRSLRFPAAAGVFSTQLGTRPTQTESNSFYFRDVVFLGRDTSPESLITWPLDQPVSFARGGGAGGPGPREFGTVFRSSVAGTITAIRVFGAAVEDGVHVAKIWKNSDDSIIAGPFDLDYGCGPQGLCGSAWVTTNLLANPVPIEANTDYTVSVSTGSDAASAYPFINQVFGRAGDNGMHLSYPAGAGVSGAVGVRPAENDPSVNPNYLRDVVFQPTGSTDSETLMGDGAVYTDKPSTAYELGTVFQSSVAGVIKGIRVYSVGAESGAHQARLWKNSDNSLIGGPYPLNYGGANGWISFPLANPVSIESGVPYTVSVSTGEDPGRAYPFVPAGFAGSGGNTKHLTYPELGGVLTTRLGTRPTEAPNGNSYLRDVVFHPSTDRPRATLGNTADGTFVDYITDGSTVPPTPYINANRVQASADMTVTTIKAKIENAPGRYKLAIYSDNTNGVGGPLGDRVLAVTQEKSNPASGYNDFPLTAPLKLKAGEWYWIGIWSDDPNARVYYTSQTGGRLRWMAATYGDWPDPIVLDPNGTGYTYCMYAEGTIDPPKPRGTIGNTADGTFVDYITDGSTVPPTPYINANRVQASANMTLTAIKAKIENAPGRYKLAIYSDNTNGVSAPLGDRLLAVSQEKSNPPTGYNDFPLTVPLQIQAGEWYWIGIWSDDPNARVYYTGQSGGRLRWMAATYGDWPDPIVLDPNGTGYTYCMFAEGTIDD